jgi:plasmid stabilization system protein ParE
LLRDLDRFFDHMAAFEISDAAQRTEEVVQAVQVLASSALIGRPVKDGKRELVIGTGGGYGALYRYLPAIDKVFMLAFRSQREAGFKRR